MTTSIDVRPDGQYLEVVHRGVLTRDELEAARTEATRLLREHGLLRLMVDGRAADITGLSDVDMFEFAAAHSSALPAVDRLRMALVVPRAHAEVARFAETVAQNRGVNLRIFFDAGSARDWLTGPGG